MNNLASLLYYTDSPLSPSQAEQLLQVFSTSGNGVTVTKYPSDINWDSTLQKASNVLSPEQMEALQQLKAEEQATNQLNALERAFRK